MWHLDHLAVAATDLAEGRAMVEDALGVPLQPGGQHLRYGTHNCLLGLAEGIYLEVIAPDPGLPRPPVRWFGLDQFRGRPRLGNWICQTEDLTAGLAASPSGAGVKVEMERGDLRWQIAVPEDGSLPMGGFWPTLISWAPGTIHPATRLTQQGVRLRRFTLHHPDAADLAAALTGHLRDDRIAFETAPTPAFTASFETPNGERTLT